MAFTTKKSSAFTLAETLITLTIIGVVASIVMPSLVQNYQEAQMKVTWKKSFSDISNAFNLIKQDHGGDLGDYFDGVTTGNASPIVTDFANKLVVATKSSNCVLATNHNLNFCDYSAYYLTQNGEQLNMNNIGHGNMSLNNGQLIIFRTWGHTYALIWVDVNGYKKGPNTLGKDLFGSVISKDKILPMGAPKTGTQNTCAVTAITCIGYGWHDGSSCAGAGCSAQYLYE